MKRFYIVLLFPLIFSSCCTMMYCECDWPRIKIAFDADPETGFTNYDISRYMLYITPSDDLTNVLDSINFHYRVRSRGGLHELHIDRDFITGELIDYSFILVNHNLNRFDTISHLDYQYKKISFVCNKCTLGKDDITTCDSPEGINYRFNGKHVVQDNEYYLVYK